MTDDDRDWTADMVRDHYNPPPATPREEIWVRLEERLADAAGPSEAVPRRDADVVRLPEARLRGWSGIRAGWMAVAATAVLAVGIGIGRVSWSPVADSELGSPTSGMTAALARPDVARANRTAAVEHLSRTEPLLTLVKADVSRGSVDPEVGAWARELLGQTRFLLDSGLPMDPEVISLLEDLEMVLFQATLVAGGEVDGARERQELDLLREGLMDRNVLPRIQAVIPTADAGFTGS